MNKKISSLNKKKTYVYIDRFNLYYGVLKNTKYKWLDLQKLSEIILPSDYEVAHVRYFTAHIIGRYKSSSHARQMAYINALNVFLGWTFLGWVVALCWSLTSDTEENFLNSKD